MRRTSLGRLGPRPGRPAAIAAGCLLIATLALMPTLHAESDAVRVDDFDHTWAPGELPKGWELQKISPLFGSGQDQLVQLVHQGETHHVHLRAGSNNSYSVGVRTEFQLAEWPVLEWEWRVMRTPKGGDVRVKERDDQAGAICVIVNPGLVGFDSLCYLWENDGPKDTPLTSTKRDDSRYLILRTVKADGTGEWYAERRNILEDYIRVFGKKPQHGAVIGMQIDADSTGSAAEVFYRNIYRRKR